MPSAVLRWRMYDPSGDRQRRQVTAGAAEADADGDGQVSKAQMLLANTVNAEPGPERHCPGRDDAARLEAVGETTRYRPRSIKDSRGDGEKCRGLGSVGAEFGRHRFEEDAKAVDRGRKRQSSRERPRLRSATRARVWGLAAASCPAIPIIVHEAAISPKALPQDRGPARTPPGILVSAAAEVFGLHGRPGIRL